MNRTRARLVAQFVGSLALILVFSSMNTYTLIILFIGAVTMALAFFSYYRPGAVLGLLLVGISAAASLEVDTLVEASMITTAVVGLMLPITLLTLFALSSEVEERSVIRRRRPMLVAGAYAGVCVMSVPVFVASVGLVLPSVTAKLSVLSETAILLLFISLGATLLTLRQAEG